MKPLPQTLGSSQRLLLCKKASAAQLYVQRYFACGQHLPYLTVKKFHQITSKQFEYCSAKAIP